VFNAMVKLRNDTVGGAIKMQTSRIGIDVDGQKISGTVAADILIKGGSAKDRTFDISGSSIAIDGVAVAGDPATNGNWNGRLDIGKGSVVWKRPMTLDISTGVHMTNTRPLIAIFESERKTHKWLEKIVTLKDVRGTATVKVKPDQFLIPYAMFKSDTIEVGVKGVIRDQDRKGVFYARYGKLAGIIAVDNKKKQFGLIGATRKFEDYVPGGPVPGINDPTAPEPEAAKKRSPFSIFRRR
jgi:translocation and assembly module TamB